MTPERKLMAAMIFLAANDISTGSQAKRRSALRYLNSQDLENPFSFLNCCEELGLEPIKTRQGVLGLKRVRVAKYLKD